MNFASCILHKPVDVRCIGKGVFEKGVRKDLYDIN